MPIVSDITSGALCRFQNKMALKSPNFKTMLKSKSQPDLETNEIIETQNDFSDTLMLKQLELGYFDIQTASSIKHKRNMISKGAISEEESEDLSISRGSSPVHNFLGYDNQKMLPNTGIISSNMSQLELASSRPISTLMTTLKRSPSLFKNLSLPKILKEQK